ncbi:MAG: hypothetical protein KGZ87_05455 [Bacteroidetes bacterium]|nr:hypothetical protein [Bacteroidota bacterium]
MRNAILNTAAYLKLDKVQQNNLRTKHQLTEIEHHYTVAKNRGKDWWLENFNPRPIYKAIVEELLNQ